MAERPDKTAEEDYGNPNYDEAPKKSGGGGGGNSRDPNDDRADKTAAPPTLAEVKADADKKLDFKEKNQHGDLFFATPSFWLILLDQKTLFVDNKKANIDLSLNTISTLRAWQKFILDDVDFLQKLNQAANPEPEMATGQPEPTTQMVDEKEVADKSTLGIAEKKTFKSGTFTIELSCLPDERTLVEITYSGGIIDETCAISKEEQLKWAEKFKTHLETAFTGEGKELVWKMKADIRVGLEKADGSAANDGIIRLVPDGYMGESWIEGKDKKYSKQPDMVGIGTSQSIDEREVWMNMDAPSSTPTPIEQSFSHEIGHSMGLPHIISSEAEREGVDIQKPLAKTELKLSGNLFNRNPKKSAFPKLDTKLNFQYTEPPKKTIAFDDNAKVEKHFKNNPVINGNLMIPGFFLNLKGSQVTESQIKRIIWSSEQEYAEGSTYHKPIIDWGTEKTDEEAYEFIYNQDDEQLKINKK